MFLASQKVQTHGAGFPWPPRQLPSATLQTSQGSPVGSRSSVRVQRATAPFDARVDAAVLQEPGTAGRATGRGWSGRRGALLKEVEYW